MIIEIDLPDNAENIRCLYEYKEDAGETVYATKVIEGVRSHCVPAKEFDMMWKKDSAQKDEREYENMLRKKIAETLRKIKRENLRCGLCTELDYSCMYASDPPQYKCEKYGCIRRVTDKCRGDKKCRRANTGTKGITANSADKNSGTVGM